MARSDLVVDLAQAATENDQPRIRRIIRTLAKEERRKQHHGVAERLGGVLQEDDSKASVTQLPTSSGNGLGHHQIFDIPFVSEHTPKRQLSDMVLSPSVEEVCSQLVEEQKKIGLLRSFNLEPRNRLLLIGPAGNGKTSLAEAIAGEIVAPFFIVRYEALIGSYLGQTTSQLGELFKAIGNLPCVLFLDEFETLAKERGDNMETGEIKRVVSTLLLQIDKLPEQVVVIAASNHPGMLDRAVWRRFQIRVELTPPTKRQRILWLEKFSKRTDLEFEKPTTEIADFLSGLCFAELEQFTLDILRTRVLANSELSPDTILETVLEQWVSRSKVC